MRGCKLVLGTIFLISAGAMAAPRACGPDKAPASRYAVTAGEVKDLEKNIVWARCMAGQSWVEGNGCVGPRLAPPAGQVTAQIPEGWRLPTIGEIATLGDICWSSEANRSVFPNISLEGIGWWISDRQINEGAPVAVRLGGGQVNVAIGQTNALVRLVKL